MSAAPAIGAPAAVAADGHARQPARIGPNAVIQTAAALRALGGEACAAEVFGAAGVAHWLAAPPDGMAGEAGVARLHREMARRAPEAAADAGRRVAAYLLANRIPAPARRLMARLPRPLAARALLLAIRANAWTFAGSGRVRVSGWRRPVVEIAGNPLAVGGCRWHAAVFEGLFAALVSPRAQVRETACCAAGAPACRFEIVLDGSG
ncbi:bacteriochlorophyll 4-vinyl reductase [Rubrimonas cliftonensis]|uniref:Divinyl protochlorophyllide a 8-vinyl-reductase n=1 Tax=Rubrimonas cliftonensis TaxID=89524 RepID=A0A1H4E302_9RHOB|nr:bacteriochlorophyll 4-vinyl reductase [Rubrimonas cliftonensis]SEA79434.1 divinyl protochlorophyllide a 8-vinyl-reductase [Rubrimonas cliftonensis]